MAKDITIDMSEVADLVRYLQLNLSEKQFNIIMYDVFKRAAGRTKKILREDLPPNYYVKAKDINAAVGKPQFGSAAVGISCVIPIKGSRGSIGGTFSAAGGAHGWQSLRKKYRVKARIVKSGQSTLPESMDHQGGQPPFRNFGSKLGKVAFTRAGKDRLPIKRVSGIAVPQMVMNRSHDDVRADILKTVTERLQHHYQRILSR